MILTKNEFNNLREEIEKALAPIAAKYNCEVSAGNIKYDDISTNVAITFNSVADGKSADQLNFEKYATAYGFAPTDYGFEFDYNKKHYVFTSFRPTARKYSCICQCEDGHTVCFTDDAIKFMMGQRGE